MRMLTDLALLKEIDDIEGVKLNSTQLRALHPEKIIVIRHTSYIYRDALCDVAKQKATKLDEYVQLGEFAERASINKNLFLKRINFMKKNNTVLFEYLKLGNVLFLKLDAEFRFLLQNYQPFYANLSHKDLVTVRLLGDLKIGFY